MLRGNLGFALTAASFLCAATTLASNASVAKDLTFGYVPASMIYPFNVATATGFEAAAKEAGVRAIVLDPKGDVARQGNAIDDLIAQRVDAIGFLPLDPIVAESFVDRGTNRSPRVAGRTD
jgi:ribose transport system substrate-binding protein